MKTPRNRINEINKCQILHVKKYEKDGLENERGTNLMLHYYTVGDFAVLIRLVINPHTVPHIIHTYLSFFV